MSAHDAYGDVMAERFRLNRADAYKVVRMGAQSTFAVTRLTCGDAGLGRTLPIPVQPAYVLILMLQPLLRHELWLDGKSIRVEPWQQGSISIVDLEHCPSAFIGSAHDALHFYLPKQGLVEFALSSGSSPVTQFEVPFGTVDLTISNLGKLLLPILSTSQEASPLFISGLLTALYAHLAEMYGGGMRQIPPCRNGLSPAQLRRVKELIASDLSGHVSLGDLAAICELSPAHFAREFKRSIGVAPHKWLLLRRVEVAKHLLSARSMKGADVAAACGFADQSHFIRVFSSLVGVTPREWQRQRS